MTGRVIFLLGTSSAGKTSTVEALQDLLTEPYLNFGLDAVFSMVPEGWGSGGGSAAGGFWYEDITADPPCAVIRYGPVGERVLAGMRATVTALVNSGNNVLVDEMPIDGEILTAWRSALEGIDVLWVRLRASDEVLRRNELGRDRTYLGIALGHAPVVDAADWVDLTLDSGALTPSERAIAILAAIRSGQPAR